MIINKKLKPDLGNLSINSCSFVITLEIAAFHCSWESIANTLPFGQFAVTWKSFTLIVTLNLAMFSWLHWSAIPNPSLTRKIKSNNILSLLPRYPFQRTNALLVFLRHFYKSHEWQAAQHDRQKNLSAILAPVTTGSPQPVTLVTLYPDAQLRALTLFEFSCKVDKTNDCGA